MLRYNLLQNVTLFCSLPQGETNRFVKAFIYKTDGTYFFGGDGSATLTHVSNGLYKSSLVFTMPVGLYKVLYVPYLDAGFTIQDDIYGTKEETLEIYTDVAVDISGIEDSINSLTTMVNDAAFEVEIEDDQTILNIEVEDDDSNVDVNIEDSSEVGIDVDEGSDDVDVEVEDGSEINVEIGD